jgi:Flp pilus assembly protein TadD
MTTVDSKGHRVRYGSKSTAAAHLLAPRQGSGQAYTSNYGAIGAGEADAARYKFKAPAVDGEYVLNAKLWYSTHQPVDRKPVLVGTDSVQIRVTKAHWPQVAQRTQERDADDWFAYGMALFRQKDAPGARKAFERSRSLKPSEPEHTVAIGRTYLEEGDLLSARSQFQNAVRMKPDSARARAWHGRTLRIMGRYAEAIDILARLTRSHPEDAATWLDLGLCQFRIGDVPAAISSFQRTLALVPDDSGAHLNLMLAYRRTMRISEARREEAMYLNLKHDGRPAPIVQNYLRNRPDEALEASLRHEHALVLKP